VDLDPVFKTPLPYLTYKAEQSTPALQQHLEVGITKAPNRTP
jgi:hypothetical protein